MIMVHLAAWSLHMLELIVEAWIGTAAGTKAILCKNIDLRMPLLVKY